MQQVSINSPAKINLWLQVTGETPDGYHNIYTIFQLIDLCDQITLLKTEGGIRVNSSGNIPKDDKNLAHRAASLIFEKYALSKGIAIEIDKHIPISAGLGGGSSNAASTIMGINRLFGLNMSKDEMIEVGREIGADVPFFLSGYQTAIGKGRGDILEKIEIEDDFSILLVNPGIKVSTAWAYSNLSLTKHIYDCKINKFASDISLDKIVSELKNDLEAVVIGKYPVIGEIKDRLIGLGALGSAMSGSGSTLFGLFRDNSSAVSANNKWNYPDCDLFITRPIRSLEDIYQNI